TEESIEIYLTAHSDSIAVNMPKIYVKFMMGSAFGVLLIILLAIITSILNIVNSIKTTSNFTKAITILRITMLIFTILVLFMITVNLFSKRVNTSPGACDNGSGSAILLKLAEIMHNFPLVHSSLTFIWCAAEEWGFYGSKGYVKAHNDYLDAHKDRIKLINVDMVGSELAYLDKASLIKKKALNAHLNQLIEQMAKDLQIEARKFSSIMGDNSDHAPFKKIGVEVCCFLAKKDVKRIHSPRDTIDLVNPEKMSDAVKLIGAVIRNLDIDDFNQ
ncbi:MAG: M28 family metallopeptidase, partial [Promethearchaeota archaeon]